MKISFKIGVLILLVLTASIVCKESSKSSQKSKNTKKSDKEGSKIVQKEKEGSKKNQQPDNDVSMTVSGDGSNSGGNHQNTAAGQGTLMTDLYESPEISNLFVPTDTLKEGSKYGDSTIQSDSDSQGNQVHETTTIETSDETVPFELSAENKFDDDGVNKVNVKAKPRSPFEVSEKCNIQDYVKAMRDEIIKMYAPISAQYFRENVEFGLGPEDIKQKIVYKYLKFEELEKVLQETAVPFFKESLGDNEPFDQKRINTILSETGKGKNRYYKYVVGRPTPEVGQDNTLSADLDLLVVDSGAGPFNTLVLLYSAKWKVTLKPSFDANQYYLDCYQLMRKIFFDILLRRVGPQTTPV